MRWNRSAICLSLRRPARCAFGIQFTTVTGNSHNFGMPLEPVRKALGSPIREQVYNTPQVQIDQNRSTHTSWALRQAQSSTPRL